MTEGDQSDDLALWNRPHHQVNRSQSQILKATKDQSQGHAQRHKCRLIKTHFLKAKKFEQLKKKSGFLSYYLSIALRELEKKRDYRREASDRPQF